MLLRADQETRLPGLRPGPPDLRVPPVLRLAPRFSRIGSSRPQSLVDSGIGSLGLRDTCQSTTDETKIYFIGDDPSSNEDGFLGELSSTTMTVSNFVMFSASGSTKGLESGLMSCSGTTAFVAETRYQNNGKEEIIAFSVSLSGSASVGWD